MMTQCYHGVGISEEGGGDRQQIVVSAYQHTIKVIGRRCYESFRQSIFYSHKDYTKSLIK